MKKIIVLLSVFLMVTICSSTAQSAAEMKARENYMTPGNVHQMLAQAEGNWTDDISMWMAPKAPATKSTATSKIEMILGGR